MACLLLIGIVGTCSAQLYMPFKPRYATTQRGGITMLGNGFLTSVALPAVNNQNPPGGTGTNNALNMTGIDVDGAAFPTAISTSDSLKLQPSSGILFAGLYWGGNASETAADRHKIKLRGPGDAAYTTITGNVIATGSSGLPLYQSFADITEFVRARGNGSYTAADPVIATGATNLSAGWTIVVVYANANLSQRKLAVYDGLLHVSTPTIYNTYNYTLTDFITPPSSAVAFEIGVVAYDGDRSVTGDNLLFGGSSLSSPISLGNTINPTGDIFNSTLSANNVAGSTQVPRYPNTLGYDRDIFVPDNAGNTFIGNNETSATLQFNTTNDNFVVSLFTLAMDVAEPDFALTKQITDINGGTLAPGDSVLYTLNVSYGGNTGATNTVLTDTLPYNLTYAPGTLRILNGPPAGNKTDASGDDVAEYLAAERTVRIRLGQGANATTGGTYNGTSANGMVSVSFKARVTNDCYLLGCGTVVANEALLNYVGATSGSTSVLKSSPVGTDGNGTPLAGKTVMDISPVSCPELSDLILNIPCPASGLQLPDATYMPGGEDVFLDAACTMPVPGNFLKANIDYYARKPISGPYPCAKVRKVRIERLDAGPDVSICNDMSFVDLPNAPTGTTWSARPGNPIGASIATPSGIVSNMLLPGTYYYVLNNPTTTCRDTVAIFRGDATINAGTNLTICQDTQIKLSGASMGGSSITGAWTISGASGFMSPNPSQLSLTGQTNLYNEVIFKPLPGTYGSVTLTLTGNAPTGSCTAASASRTITVVPKAVVDAGPNNGTCSLGAITLTGSTAAPAGAQAAWSIVSGNGSLSSTSPTNTPQAVTFTPSSEGMTVLRLTASNPAAGCPAVYDERTIMANSSPATPTLYANTVCEGGTLSLTASSSTPGVGYFWTYPSGATGTMQNPSFTQVDTGMEGNYTVTATAGACSSAVAGVYVPVLRKTSSTLTQTACSSYTLNGTTYNTSGIYTQIRPNHLGCDSTITLNLTINQPTAYAFSHTACSSYTLNGITYNTSGIYTQVRPNHSGCDSTITLNLAINQPTSYAFSHTACSSYTLNGITYNTSGIYTQVRPNHLGCDSTITLNLTINQPTSYTLSHTACSSYTLNGTMYNTSGIYTQVRTNHLGCDSTITLNLTINQPTSYTLSHTACSSYTLNGTSYNTSGIYTQIRPNHLGCDSTITLTLTINQPTSHTFPHTACSSYTLNGTTYNASGVYTQIRPNHLGCDSTIMLNLTINQPTSYTFSHTACSSYTLNGITYNTSGIYTQVRPNHLGCDSTITLNLTINQPTAYAFPHTACSSYTLNGITYNTSGIYTQIRPNHLGCDSTITLNLTINQPTSYTLSHTACSSYTLNGTSYNTSGIYTQIRPNHLGCDSTITLNLTINQPTAYTLSQTACSSYTLNGTTYNTSGAYTQIRPNHLGCDSTITLDLTINQPSASTLTQTSCGSFTLNGETYTQSGTYTQTLVNAAGCDSMLTIHLTVEQIDASVTQNGTGLTANNGNAGTTYQWIDCTTGNAIPGATTQTYTATANGSYQVAVTQGSCTDTSDCFAVHTVGIKEAATIDATVYPNPNDGEFTISLGAIYPDIRIELYDMNGKPILQRRWYNTNTVTINEVLSSGVYQVHIHAGGTVLVKSVIRK